jgi:transposase
MARGYHQDLRSRAIDLLKSGLSKRQASELLQVGVRTLHYWWDIFEKEGRMMALQGYQKGYDKKIKDLGKFEKFINDNPNKTQEELGKLWENPCTAATIGKALRAIDYTYKKRASL